MLEIILDCVVALVSLTTRLFFMVLPSLLVLFALNTTVFQGNKGVPAPSLSRTSVIHELIPNSSWNDLAPCGQYFNEQEEFDKARSCVNEKVWSDTPLTTNVKDFPIPRCYIIKAQSPNILSKEGINFIPVFDPTGFGAVVGVYQPETHTVYVVENVDAPMVYRHELQHYFLHEHDPVTEGGGHNQPIWSRCEPPYYTPSKRAVELGKEQESLETKPSEKKDSAKTAVKKIPNVKKYLS